MCGFCWEFCQWSKSPVQLPLRSSSYKNVYLATNIQMFSNTPSIESTLVEYTPNLPSTPFNPWITQAVGLLEHGWDVGESATSTPTATFSIRGIFKALLPFKQSHSHTFIGAVLIFVTGITTCFLYILLSCLQFQRQEHQVLMLGNSVIFLRK